jgi:hypothetical protein
MIRAMAMWIEAPPSNRESSRRPFTEILGARRGPMLAGCSERVAGCYFRK